MYCMNCGVKLADTEKTCPLCGIRVFHPDLTQSDAAPLYPRQQPLPQVNSRAAVIVLSTLFLVLMLTPLICDLQLSGGITWSGYVIGGLALAYIIAVLPIWFHKPNPVIFVPCDFAAAALYLLYIDLATGGQWFLSFALPITVAIAVIVTAVVTLLRYIHRGRLYVYGGAACALGLYMPMLEYLLYRTFDLPHFPVWSLYPLVALMLIGGMLILLAIHRPTRETMKRKFFI